MSVGIAFLCFILFQALPETIADDTENGPFGVDIILYLERDPLYCYKVSLQELMKLWDSRNSSILGGRNVPVESSLFAHWERNAYEEVYHQQLRLASNTLLEISKAGLFADPDRLVRIAIIDSLLDFVPENDPAGGVRYEQVFMKDLKQCLVKLNQVTKKKWEDYCVPSSNEPIQLERQFESLDYCQSALNKSAEMCKKPTEEVFPRKRILVSDILQLADMMEKIGRPIVFALIPAFNIDMFGEFDRSRSQVEIDRNENTFQKTRPFQDLLLLQPLLKDSQLKVRTLFGMLSRWQPWERNAKIGWKLIKNLENFAIETSGNWRAFNDVFFFKPLDKEHEHTRDLTRFPEAIAQAASDSMNFKPSGTYGLYWDILAANPAKPRTCKYTETVVGNCYKTGDGKCLAKLVRTLVDEDKQNPFGEPCADGEDIIISCDDCT